MPSTISAGTTAGTAIAIAGDTTGNLAFQTNGTTTAMTIDTSQNVGIGTTSPVGKVQITGASASRYLTLDAPDRGGYVTFSAAGTAFADIGSQFGLTGSGSATNLFLTTRSTNNLIFGTNDTERMRLDSSGFLLLGTTATDNPAGGFTFYVSNQNHQLQIGHENGASSGNTYIKFCYNSGTIGNITQNGTTAVAYNTSSDYRLKENIAPMIGALAKVAQLKPVTYKWKSDGSDGQGFIAHELQAVVPDCVTGEKDAVELVDIKDEEGNVIGQEEKPVYQGVDTSFLVATLTAAIQELKAELDATKAEVAALKGA